MDLIKRFASYLIKFFPTNYSNTISKFVLYKIIDLDENKRDVYMIQCVNSKSIFAAHIFEIVFDTDILYGLHPLQSCFIGIEYAKHIKNNAVPKKQLKKINSMDKPVFHPYGILKLKYQDRKGDICFINSNTGEETVMNPRDIAFSDTIIKKFHSEHAFYIGLCAGQKIHNTPKNVTYLSDFGILNRKNSEEA